MNFIAIQMKDNYTSYIDRENLAVFYHKFLLEIQKDQIEPDGYFKRSYMVI